LKKELFYFDVPSELIAQSPLSKRDASRLLVCHSPQGELRDEQFCHLPQILNSVFPQKKILLVANDSRVYPARVRVRRKTGARGEVFFLETGDEKKQFHCLLRPTSKLKPGEILYADSETHPGDLMPLFRVESMDPPLVALADPHTSLQKILNEFGEMPLPPYIQRDPHRVDSRIGEMDKERYQTVYSHPIGSSAAPTAGLHFTDDVMASCASAGISFAYV